MRGVFRTTSAGQLLSRHQQNFSRRHVCGVLGQGLRNLFERKPRLNFRLKFSSKKSLYLACDAELADESATAQPCAEPEAFHVLAFKDQARSISTHCPQRQCAIDNQASAARLRGQHTGGHISGDSIESNRGAKLVTLAAKSRVESGVTAVEDVLGAYGTKSVDLLTAPHNVDDRNRKPLPQTDDHASKCAGRRGLHDSAMTSTPGFIHQRPSRKRINQ